MAWKYFSLKTDPNLACKCCGECKMDEHFMGMLDALRKYVGQILLVNSGYRCPKHDKEENGSGNHTQGRAVDFYCIDSHLRFLVMAGAILLGFKRIGIAKTFIHLDLCGDKPQEVVWLY